MTPKKYDVIVAGAGPAGLLAARAAAESGLNVALLEKKKDPGRVTRACGQTLVSMNERLFGNYCNYNPRNKLIVFPSEGFSVPYDGPYRNIYAVFNHAPNGHRLMLGVPARQRSMGDAGRVALSFDKELLLRQLVDWVKAVGVEVFPGAAVEKVESSEKGVGVEAGNQSYESEYLVAADGTNSAVARMAGFNEDRAFFCNLYGLAYEVSGIAPPEHDVLMRVADWANGTYTAMFNMPRFQYGDAILALVSVDPRAHLEAALEYFTTKSFCASWYRNMKKGRRWTAGVACYAPLENPYRNRVLVAGDAAATQELENTGAMMSGWKAGQALATAMFENRIGREAQGINEYIKWWHAVYVHGPGITPEEYMKSFATPLMFSGPDDLNRFFGQITEPMPAVYNPYVSPTSAVMKRLMPVLAAKYPDIIDKMKKRGLPASELFKPVGSITGPCTEA